MICPLLRATVNRPMGKIAIMRLVEAEKVIMSIQKNTFTVEFERIDYLIIFMIYYHKIIL